MIVSVGAMVTDNGQFPIDSQSYLLRFDIQLDKLLLVLHDLHCDYITMVLVRGYDENERLFLATEALISAYGCYGGSTSRICDGKHDCD